MMETRDAPRPVSPGDVVGYLVGVAGLAACITVVFLAMRAVMDIGGACADGGPFVVAQPCPDGVGVLMSAAFPLMFLFGGIMAWRGSRLGEPHGGLVLLAWPALFLSLGWNFLEYAFRYPGEGVIWGWLMCGVMFTLMGGVPLLGLLLLPDGPRPRGRVVSGRDGREPRTGASSDASTAAADAAVTWQSRRRLAELQRLQRSLKRAVALRASSPTARVGSTGRAAASGAAGVPIAPSVDVDRAGAADHAGDDLVSRLERLAMLRGSGALTESEFQAAKTHLIAGDGPGT